MRKLYTHPWLIVAIVALFTVFFAFQLPRAELENNNLRFVPSDNPALKTSQWIDSNFGSSFFILIGLEREYGTIFDSSFLNRIREYTNAIQEISIVKEVTSIISSDYITSDGDAIIAEKLVGDDFSGSPEEIAELKRRLLSWDMYDRALFSDDFTATQILVPLTINSDEAASKEVTEKFLQIRDIARETFSGFATVYVTGMPIIAATVNEAMNTDLKLLIPLVILVLVLVLFFSFRGFTAMILPLLTVIIATIWSVGAMPIFGIRLSVISTVLPVILMAVGSAYGIHVVTHYLTGCKGASSRDEHREMVISVVMKIRRPVFITAITTVAAFGSFCFTSVAPCREFGYFASFGVAVAFTIAITLIPALLIIRGPLLKQARTENITNNTNNKGGTVLADSLLGIARYSNTIFFLTILVCVFSLYGVSKLIIDNVMVEYFREDTDIRRSDTFIRRQFGGSKVISVVVEADTGHSQDAGRPIDACEIILRPDTLAAMDGLSAFLQYKVPNVGKVMGFTDLVKRINQVFNADESPEGIRPVQTVSPGTGFGFGFDDADDSSADDFGFGDFGFDDFGSFGDFGDFGAEQGGEYAAEISGDDKLYTRNELISLFDRAGNVSRGMNANDLVRELKRQVNYDGASYYEIPLDPQRYGKETSDDLRRLISNYLVLLSGNISAYANDPMEPSMVKATVQLRTTGMEDSQAVFREIERYAAANFPPDVKVTLGGTTMVEGSLNDLVVQSQLISILVSIIMIFIIITIANKSLVAGCLSIAPLSISVLINFAVMGFAGIKLNLGTSMVTAVSVGVGIDYTIHCIEAYKREYKAASQASAGAPAGGTNFLWHVFFDSGKAIIINAVSVGAGFAVLLFSRFIMLADLGLLIAIAMLSSALVSLTVLPALIAIVKPKFIMN